MRGTFRTKSVYGLRSMNNGKSYTVKEGNKIVKYSYRSGKTQGVIFDGTAKGTELVFTNYEFSADEKKILLTTKVRPMYRHSFKAQYMIYDVETKTLTPLAADANQEVASFSPNGLKVAFVRDNNLFYYDIATAKEFQVTKDGEFNKIIFGKSDWVYEEEFALVRGYEWSPDSEEIAFWKFDEERVKEFNLAIYVPGGYPQNATYKYPRAGEQNSIVSIHTYNLVTSKNATMDIGNEQDIYVPRIKWTNNSESLLVFRMNRLQNTLDILRCSASTGESTKIYTESDKCYINQLSDNSVILLNDKDSDKYIIQSERDGFNHLYLYSIGSGLVQQITKGGWDVTDLLGVDGKKIYYLSAETSPIKRNLYSINLDGTGKKRITFNEGYYDIHFSKDFSYFISYFSNSSTPNTVTLHTANGKRVRMLEDNSDLKKKIAEYKVPQKEFFSFTTSEGVILNGYMIKPNGFDTSKRYPVFMTQYSGPGSQQVLNNWSLGWEQVLVQEGYILVCVDGRGTGGRGADFRKVTYGNLGKYEMIDQIEAAKYLGTLDYVDSSRIGIYGWSYGGYMALNCILKGADVFKAAIAVAPVSTWRYYDTVYTERYNGLPQDNASGYDDNSPLSYANLLKGKLLIAHGTGDDNVHVQHSFDMIYALQGAGKHFDMAIYPNLNHSMLPSWNHRHNLMLKCIEFIKENL